MEVLIMFSFGSIITPPISSTVVLGYIYSFQEIHGEITKITDFYKWVLDTYGMEELEKVIIRLAFPL